MAAPNEKVFMSGFVFHKTCINTVLQAVGIIKQKLHYEDG
jgi:hypothetical protein